MSIQKYVITGHILEVYDYEKYVCGRGGKKSNNESEDLENVKEEIKNKNLGKCNYKQFNFER